MIQLPRKIVDGIIHQALAELPNEACGLLGGKDLVVKEQYALTNIDASFEHFSFDPAEQFQALRTARASGLSIIANYHSHPSTPSRPSEEDVRLAYDSEILYLIVSLALDKPVLKAFNIRNGYSVEVGIKVVD